MKKKILIAVGVIVLIPLVIYFAFPQVILGLSVKSARKDAGMEMKSATAGNYTIAYLEGGKGEPVVLLHGLGGNKDNWPKFAKTLTGSYRVIALDLPGCGESTKAELDIYSTAAQVERLEKIFNALNLKKFHLAGHAMGGAIAARYAAKHPDRIISLALLDTDGVKVKEQSEFDKEMEKGNNPLKVESTGDFENLMKFLFFKPPSVPGPVKRYMTKLSMNDAPFNQKIFWDIFGEDYQLTGDLAGSRVKTLVVWGDTDRRFHVKTAEAIVRAVPGTRSVIIKDCGHFPMREKPDETASAYRAFLAGK